MTYHNYPAAGEGEPMPSSGARQLTCTVCSGTSFTIEEMRLQGRYGFSQFLLQASVCTSCRHTMFFRID